MKKYYFIYPGTILIIIGVAFLTISYSSGPPTGYTGSPADGRTCWGTSGCHGGKPVITQTGWIASNIPGSGYKPDSTYAITATVIDTGVTKFGFQLSPQDNAGNLLGTLTAGAGMQLMGLDKYIEHDISGTSGTDFKTWTFTWKAPAQGTGAVTFYAAFNASNNNGAPNGDQIYTSALTVQEDPTSEIWDENAGADLRIYPNPNTGVFSILNLPLNAEEISIYNITGKKIYNSFFSQKPNPGSSIHLDISEPGRGMYFMEIKYAGGSVNKKIMVM